MIYSYKESINKFGSDYALKNALKEKKIFKIGEGLYSIKENPKDLELFIKKHKGFVFTMESAFYYLGISDFVPDTYVIATDKDATKYKSNNLKQYFLNNHINNIGASSISYNGIDIPIFDKERMLIEVIRYKNKLPLDYYKEIINYYRNHTNEISFSKISEYLQNFPKKEIINKIIQFEVL